MAERVLYYDCTAGISGDMHLGAMIDLGVPLAYLDGELRKLGVAGWTLRTTRDARRGISGTRADVLLDSDADHDHAPHSHEHGHAHTHAHEHEPHAHPYPHSHESEHHGHEHAHRPHREIVALIERSGLTSGAKQRARAIFARLAEAEAKIPGMRVEDVLFHEVGAVDSIVDIVGAAVALDWIKPDRVLASPVELGSGFVHCAHGRLPVPAPATAEILRGVPTHAGAVAFEACTPTGAAILAATVDAFTTEMSLSIERIGYGIGHKDGPIANVLRVFLATSAASAAARPSVAAAPTTIDREDAIVLECNLDDMTGEAAGYVLERLLANGASDAWTTPILMKKSRPAFTLSVLCPPEREAALAQLLLRETTTLGLRRRDVTKLVLPRTVEQIATPFGLVRVKTGWLDGRPVKRKPEHEDLQRLAAERSLPLREIEQAVLAEISRQPPAPPPAP
jgi:uncharacterized protein (TIGR00299 family) protein